MTTGTCLGGSSTTINLATTASDNDSAYRGMQIDLTGGTGSGQSAYIAGYRIDKNASGSIVGRVVIIDGTFNPIPVSGSTTYLIQSKAQAELQKLAPSAIIELYQLKLFSNLHNSSDTYYFHAGVNGLNANMVFNQQTYTRMPITSEGFEYASSGTLPRPRLTISNLSDIGTQLLLIANGFNPGNDLGGARVTRIRTLAKFIDAANYPVTYTGTYTQPGTATVTVTVVGHTLQSGDKIHVTPTSGTATSGLRTVVSVNGNDFTYTAPDQPNTSGNINIRYSATADPNARMPDEVYFIDRKTTETRDTIQWELASALDLANVRIPKRQVIANICQWTYRSAECSYTGTNYFNAEDVSVTSAGQDVCGKRLSSCKKRFSGTLPFGSFPGIGQRK
jgi:phage-related protein